MTIDYDPESRRNLKLKDLNYPDYAWLTYCVCDEGCHWEGWILEDARFSGKTVSLDKSQLCPECRKMLFRTEASVHYVPTDTPSE